MKRTCPYDGRNCNASCGRYHDDLKECADVALVDVLKAISDGHKGKAKSFDDIYSDYVQEREQYWSD